MNQIKVLDKSIYNRIAAGEVVERPLSIVKELVENSIDAGATAISIDIKEGGMKRISVSDNGKGIAPEDVPTAFLAHAQPTASFRSSALSTALIPRLSAASSPNMSLTTPLLTS